MPTVFYSLSMVKVYLAIKNINNVAKEGASLIRSAFNRAAVIIVNAKVNSSLKAKKPCGAIALKRERQLAQMSRAKSTLLQKGSVGLHH